MEICIVHGSPRKKNTYAAVQEVKKSLLCLGEVQFTEFYLQEEQVEFCRGCFSCILGREKKCPHAETVQPIIEALLRADGVIFATPVYVLDMTAQMKAFFDHTGYFFMVHRPYPAFFQKPAWVISTAAGGGTKDTNRSVARILRYWGISRIFCTGISIYAMGWDGIPAERKRKLERQLQKTAGRFYRTLQKKPGASLRTHILFAAMKRIQRKDSVDWCYWKEQGWLDGKKPF